MPVQYTIRRRYNSSGSEDLQRPVLHISAIVLDQDKSKSVSMIDTFVLSLQALQLRLDDIWLLALLIYSDLLAQDPYNANTRFQSSHGIDSVMKNIQQKLYRVVNSMFVLDLGRDQKTI